MSWVEYESCPSLGGGELSRKALSAWSAVASSSRRARRRAAAALIVGRVPLERPRFGCECLDLAGHDRALSQDIVHRDKAAPSEIGQLTRPRGA